jgi:hypothetical protein
MFVTDYTDYVGANAAAFYMFLCIKLGFARVFYDRSGHV